MRLVSQFDYKLSFRSPQKGDIFVEYGKPTHITDPGGVEQ